MLWTAQERLLCTMLVSDFCILIANFTNVLIVKISLLRQDVGKYLVRLSLRSNFIWIKSSTIFGIERLNVISVQFISNKGSQSTLEVSKQTKNYKKLNHNTTVNRVHLC